MRISLLDLKDPRHGVVDKTIAGGMGTASRYGASLLSSVLLTVKGQAVRMLPYPVAQVSAILRAQGHRVRYLDRLDWRDCDLVVLFAAIPSYRVDLRALSVLRRQGIPAVVVGTVTHGLAERYREAALVVRGEADAFFLQPGWPAQVPQAGAGEVLDVGRVADLALLPFPDWSIFPRLHSRYAILAPGATVLPVMTSRGCPFPCGYYCPYPLGEGDSLRYRPVVGVVEELQKLDRDLGVRHVKLRDPILTLNRARAEALLDAFLHADLRTRWGCETHFSRLDDALLEQMARAGCRLIQAGIETLTPEALKQSRRKNAPLEVQRQLLETCKRVGIQTAIYLIIGLPGDTVQTVRATLQAVANLPATALQVTVCTPYPGTAYYEQVRGALKDTDWERFDQYTPVGDTPEMPAHQVPHLMSSAYRQFYLRPGWLTSALPVLLRTWHERLRDR